MIERIRQMVIDFILERMNGASKDPVTLLPLLGEVEYDLRETDMSAEAVYNAFDLLFALGKHEERVKLLQDYLQKDLSAEEEAWARWNITDAYALADKYDETVSTQTAFYSWAQANLPKDYLLLVMQDCTQAFGWFRAGKGDEWVRIFNEITHSVPETPDNRYHRFQLYRTACSVLCRNSRAQEALPLAQKVIAISDEDPAWITSFWAKIAGYTLLAQVYREINDDEQFLTAVTEAKQLISGFSSTIETQELPECLQTLGDEVRYSSQLGRYCYEDLLRISVLALRGACTEFGILLYQSKQYSDAVYLLDIAMRYGKLYQYFAKCYVGSLWMHTHDLSKVQQFIDRVSPIFSGDTVWLSEVPELASCPITNAKPIENPNI